jgi:hydroxymethylbilane synthase
MGTKKLNADPLIIATRKSKLALWQAEDVQRRLAGRDIPSKLLMLSTRGDELLDRSLAAIGGKGLFIKELQVAMRDGRADLAVHSMKDVPAMLPPDFHISAILPREDPTDAFVSNHYESLGEMPAGSVVGTCSLRRKSQVLSKFPHLTVIDLRGNVNTRLQKLDDARYDAIILASAGLKRLGLDERIRQSLPVEQMMPACAQGAIGIECGIKNEALNALLAPLHDQDTADRVNCERRLNAGLGGSCQTPIGGIAELDGQRVSLRALVAEPDGSRMLFAEGSDLRENAVALGQQVAEKLIAQGADQIIDATQTPTFSGNS